jgi:hypothetical protein
MLSLALLPLFWLALALPGFACLWRWDRISLEGGALAALARSYLASFMLLTPLAVLGYALHLPLYVFSGAVLVALAWALGSLARDRSWLGRPRWPGVAAAIGGTLVGLDFLMGAAAGTHLGGDAGYHVARVRSLMELGFNNWDPLIDGQHFDLVYHTNLYHALIACGAQLTGNDPGSAWLQTWPFAKLLTAAAAYQLGVVVFGARWLGWTAAIATLAYYASYAILPFPNTLAPVAFVPMGLSAAIEACNGRHSYRPALWLGASALALAELHSLNAVFLALVAAPLLLLVLLYRALLRRPGQRYLFAALLACGASLPWLLVAAAPRIEALWEAQPAAERPHAADSGENEDTTSNPDLDTVPARKIHKAEYFRRLPNGRYMLEPRHLIGASDRNLPGLYVFMFTLLFKARRRVLALGAFAGITCAWLVVPILCTSLLFAIGAPWAVGRIGAMLTIALCVVLPAAPLSILSRFRSRRWLRALLDGAALVLALQLLSGLGINQKPWDKASYQTAVLGLRVLGNARSYRDRSQFFSANLPRGSNVMAATRWDYNLPMHCGCHTIALSPGRGWHGVPYMDERRARIDEFFARGTTGQRRLEILRQYDASHVFTSRTYAGKIVESLRGRAKLSAVSRHGAIVSVRL